MPITQFAAPGEWLKIVDTPERRLYIQIYYERNGSLHVMLQSAFAPYSQGGWDVNEITMSLEEYASLPSPEATKS